uniref:Uncharacterized protein n=1 Tax=Glossina pallidipes TaxID=7398 RepID=A0A1A9Z6Z3_GLOPL
MLISEKGKKFVEGLFHRSETGGDIENNLLFLKNKIISKKQSMLSQQKTTSFTSSKEDGASVSSNQCETETEDLETYQKDLKALISNMKKKNTDFQTANGKNVLISEKGKKLMEGL